MTGRAVVRFNGTEMASDDALQCNRPFRLRKTGGRAQRFCRSTCRRAFHAAARRWALDAIEAGVLSITDLKKGTQPTCALPETASAVAPKGLFQNMVVLSERTLDPYVHGVDEEVDERKHLDLRRCTRPGDRGLQSARGDGRNR